MGNKSMISIVLDKHFLLQTVYIDALPNASDILSGDMADIVIPTGGRPNFINAFIKPDPEELLRRNHPDIEDKYVIVVSCDDGKPYDAVMVRAVKLIDGYEGEEKFNPMLIEADNCELDLRVIWGLLSDSPYTGWLVDTFDD